MGTWGIVGEWWGLVEDGGLGQWRGEPIGDRRASETIPHNQITYQVR